MKKIKSKFAIVLSLLLAITLIIDVQASTKAFAKPAAKPKKAVVKPVVKPTEKLSTNYYQTKEGGYKIKLPANWVTQEENGQDMNMLTSASKDGMTKIMIGSMSGADGVTLDDAMTSVGNKFISEMIGDLQNCKQVKKQKIKVSGKDTYWLEYTGIVREQGVTIKISVNMLVTVNGDKLYLGVVLGGGPKWSRNTPIYKQSLMSITPDKNL